MACAGAEAVYNASADESKRRWRRLPVERRKANDEAPNRRRRKESPSVGVDVGASHVVQRYVPRPLRVFGRKVDLRVYVLVTGWGPRTRTRAVNVSADVGRTPNAPLGVRAYAYAEGLVRFAAAPCDAFDADEARHLTNNALAAARETRAPRRFSRD